LYCRRVQLQLNDHGKTPLILACNHPNSFLDALIIASHYKRPVYFLARGDIFSSPFVRPVLQMMNMIPIFRMQEGKQHLKQNETTFTRCLEVLKDNGVILIFSEGICRNEWSVRPLKKGTARLAWMAINDKQICNLTIAPISLSYSSFKHLPITVDALEGKTVAALALKEKEQARFFRHFNQLLARELIENARSENQMAAVKCAKLSKQLVIFIPAFIGWLTHKGLYNFCKAYAYRRTIGTVFFHSVLFGLLLILYPITLALLTIFTVLITGSYYFWLLLILLPFTAWCYKESRS
jgi:1-acyl-sn-glycerol-3-phosphate acyltransferase